MTEVNVFSLRKEGGGKSLPATAAIRIELLVPGSAPNQSSERNEATAEQSQAYLHRDHPFHVSQNGPGPGNRTSI
jgi:hypothetical protein